MTFSRLDENERPIEVRVDDERIQLRFEGGLELSVPTSQYPRLKNAAPECRVRWELTGNGSGIHWPDVDEDLSVRGLFQTGRSLPEFPAEQIPALLSDLLKTTGRLNKLFPGRPFTPDGQLVGSIGEVVAEYIYDVHLEPCSTPQIDARTEDGRTVQVKLTRGKAAYGFRWPPRGDEAVPHVLIGLRLTEKGFEEMYNGDFPRQTLAGKSPQRNGQVQISLAALKAVWSAGALPQRRSFEAIKRLFTPELAEVA